MFVEINVSPFATNVLDLVGRTDIVTRSGQSVEVKHFTDFHISIDGGAAHTFYDNGAASAFLNRLQVGRMAQ